MQCFAISHVDVVFRLPHLLNVVLAVGIIQIAGFNFGFDTSLVLHGDCRYDKWGLVRPLDCDTIARIGDSRKHDLPLRSAGRSCMILCFTAPLCREAYRPARLYVVVSAKFSPASHQSISSLCCLKVVG